MQLQNGPFSNTAVSGNSYNKKLNTRAATPKVKGQTSPAVFLLLSASPGASEVPVLVFVPRQRRVYLLSPSTGVRPVCASLQLLFSSWGWGAFNGCWLPANQMESPARCVRAGVRAERQSSTVSIKTRQ